ncbi:MAG: hypothetical protein K6B12_03935 [Clostridiales bacterium]|nr:hypothetical protein [Clostridiales bacterium]
MQYIIGALIIGYIIFIVLGVRMGHRPLAVMRMSLNGVRTTIALLLVLLLIGILTGTWRSAGTIVTIVWYGVQLIRPPLFLLITFLLTCLLSYALGTSFGVAGTAGVIFMTIARSGGVDPILTAGVVLSGIYFGDRTSPASSTAFTVAALTGTDLYTNVKNMLRTGFIPWLLCLVFYTYLSVTHPVSSIDPNVLRAFEDTFSLSPWTLLPAAVILLFPLLKIHIAVTLSASIAAAGAAALTVQHVPVTEFLRAAILGYASPDPAVAGILNGGGLLSMLSTVVIITIACSYTGILDGTGMIRTVQARIERLAARIGLFPAMILLCLVSASVFCNQIMGILLSRDLLRSSYEKQGIPKESFALDIENTAITLPALIPWCILCSVPLALLGVSYAAVPFAVYVYAVPLVNLAAKRLQKNR